jgi:hypothetical protein
MFNSTFMRDLMGRYFRTALQIFFTSIAVGGVQIFDERTANSLAGAILLIASLVPTAFAAWKTSREKKAAELLKRGDVAEAQATVRAPPTGPGLH